MRTVALGIVSYNNSPRQLRQLARSIELAARPLADIDTSVAIYTIDNGDRLDWPATSTPLRRIDSIGNVGFGAAMNELMRAAFADADIFAFVCVNPDGVFHHAALRELLDVYRRYPDGLVEARQFPEELPKEYDPKTLDTAWASGACLLIPRTVYEKVGGFDPGFFMYMEDVDLSWRVRAAGLSVKLAPRALFSHAIVHRSMRPDDWRRSLLSARYLAHKWKKPSFVRWTEEEMLRRGVVASRNDLPDLPAVEFAMDERHRAIADELGTYPALAPMRWGGMTLKTPR